MPCPKRLKLRRGLRDVVFLVWSVPKQPGSREWNNTHTHSDTYTTRREFTAVSWLFDSVSIFCFSFSRFFLQFGPLSCCFCICYFLHCFLRSFFYLIFVALLLFCFWICYFCISFFLHFWTRFPFETSRCLALKVESGTLNSSLDCIFGESIGQEEIDPLSIAAEDSRLMWAQFCLVLQCIAMYCNVESELGVVASHQQAGCGQVLATVYTLFILIWGGLASAAQTHIQADWAL